MLLLPLLLLLAEPLAVLRRLAEDGGRDALEAGLWLLFLAAAAVVVGSRLWGVRLCGGGGEALLLGGAGAVDAPFSTAMLAVRAEDEKEEIVPLFVGVDVCFA